MRLCSGILLRILCRRKVFPSCATWEAEKDLVSDYGSLKFFLTSNLEDFKF